MITGSALQRLAKCPLEYLWLYYNLALSGTIPSEIGDLSLLQDLKLSNCSFTGNLPSELGRLKSLEEILLSGLDLRGSIDCTIPYWASGWM